MRSKLAFALACCACVAPAWAQTPAAAPPAPVDAPAAPAASNASLPAVAPAPGRMLLVDPEVDRKEPNVQHTVIEDGGSKIDELVVRGQVQHLIVTPKVGTTKSYEIIVPQGGREQIDGTGGPMSAVGKRVWSIFTF